ncbi:unnamed protein product, partial [Ilex paraguariensis]
PFKAEEDLICIEKLGDLPFNWEGVSYGFFNKGESPSKAFCVKSSLSSFLSILGSIPTPK